ncbi:MAG: hydrolase, partial [Hylemonella sp.]
MRTPLLRLSTVLASGLLLAACAVTPPPAAPGATQAKAELLWLGQSTFRLTTPSGKVIVTDPWLRPNPKT